MKDLKYNNLCSNGGELLAYLYDEMPAADRETFELHLANCGTCIDDFAEVSQGRYPIYEWKSLEFDPLPTPRFVMPEQQARSGILHKLRAAFAANRGIAFGGAAAAVFVAMLAGYSINFQTAPQPDVAVAVPEPVASPTQRVIAPPAADEIKPIARNEVNEPNVVSHRDPAKPPTPVRASVLKTGPVGTSEEKTRVQPRIPVRSIPVLSVAEEDEDKTLRLADIFEEIGASE